MLDYVLVRAHKDQLLEVRDRLLKIAAVRELHPLFGEWDLILKVSGEPALEGADIASALQGVRGVTATKWLGVSRIVLDDELHEARRARLAARFGGALEAA